MRILLCLRHAGLPAQKTGELDGSGLLLTSPLRWLVAVKAASVVSGTAANLDCVGLLPVHAQLGSGGVEWFDMQTQSPLQHGVTAQSSRLLLISSGGVQEPQQRRWQLHVSERATSVTAVHVPTTCAFSCCGCDFASPAARWSADRKQKGARWQ